LLFREHGLMGAVAVDPAASRAQAAQRGIGTSDPGMIGYTLPKIRRLLTSLVQRCSPAPESVWS
jgi:hypothetical protein